jgi:hypothetical protein
MARRGIAERKRERNERKREKKCLDKKGEKLYRGASKSVFYKETVCLNNDRDFGGGSVSKAILAVKHRLG